MSNASVVKKLEELAPDTAVRDCLRDLFLYELRIADKSAPQFREQYKTVLGRNLKAKEDSVDRGDE